MAATLPIDRIESLNLIKHGTQPSKLCPANIVQAAKADLRSLEFNRDLKRTRAELREKRLPTKHTGPARQYAFVRKHVLGAKTPAQIIAAAIEGISDGAGSSSVSTARLYADLDLLYEALALAEAA